MFRISIFVPSDSKHKAILLTNDKNLRMKALINQLESMDFNSFSKYISKQIPNIIENKRLQKVSNGSPKNSKTIKLFEKTVK